MDKKEQVVKVITDWCNEPNWLIGDIPILASQIDQIYNQPDPELREKIAELIYGYLAPGCYDSREFELSKPTLLIYADQILSLLQQANPKEPVTDSKENKEPDTCPYVNGCGLYPDCCPEAQGSDYKDCKILDTEREV
jgi:hypothetical protein